MSAVRRVVVTALVAGALFAPAAARADGSANGNASFHDPTKTCGNPTSFTAEFTVAVHANQIVMVQKNNGARVTGSINPANGNFLASGGGRSYIGHLDGALLTATHTYNNGSCTAQYAVTMTLDKPIFTVTKPAPPSASAASTADSTPPASQPLTTTSTSSNNTPWWLLIAGGILAVGAGFYLWNRPGPFDEPADDEGPGEPGAFVMPDFDLGPATLTLDTDRPDEVVPVTGDIDRGDVVPVIGDIGQPAPPSSSEIYGPDVTRPEVPAFDPSLESTRWSDGPAPEAEVTTDSGGSDPTPEPTDTPPSRVDPPDLPTDPF